MVNTLLKSLLPGAGVRREPAIFREKPGLSSVNELLS
jgi:hypothetical protein